MTALIPVRAGTISIANGATALTGVDTTFSLAAVSGGMLFAGDGFGWIESVQSDTAATLGLAWNGASVTNGAYVILRNWAEASLLVNAQDRVTELIRLMRELDAAGLTTPDAYITTLADRDAFDGEADGFVVALVPASGQTGKPAYYVRTGATAGVWSGSYDFGGEAGAAATVQVGTVTTGPVGGAVSVTNSGTPDAAVLNFSIPRGDRGYRGGSHQLAYADEVNMGDPGAGLFRLNNTTPALSTLAAIGGDAATLAMIAGHLASTSSIKARMVITTTSARLEFDVTAVADNTSWLQVTISGGVLSGTIADGEACEIVFARTGQKGDKGDQGDKGDAGAPNATVTAFMETVLDDSSADEVLATLGLSGAPNYLRKTKVLPPPGTDAAANNAALRAAIDECTGGETIRFTKGTVPIASDVASNLYIFPIDSLAITLEGNGYSELRMQDAQTNFLGVFGPAGDAVAQGFDDFRMIGMRIDMNSQTSAVTAFSDLQTRGRYVASCYGCASETRNVILEGNTILNADSRVVLYFPEPVSGENKFIRASENVLIDARIGGNGTDYDQSLIQTNGKYVQYLDNRVVGESWARAPSTAFELHAAYARVSGNIVDKMQLGCWLTAIRKTTYIDQQIIAQGNAFSVDRAAFFAADTTQFGSSGDTCRDLQVLNNTVAMRWREHLHDKNDGALVRIMHGTGASDMDVINVVGNTVIYDVEDTVSPLLDRTGVVGTRGVVAMAEASTAPIITIRSVKVAGNKIDDAPLPLVAISNVARVTIDNLALAGNETTGMGSASTTASAALRTAVSVDAIVGKFSSVGNIYGLGRDLDSLMYLRDRSPSPQVWPGSVNDVVTGTVNLSKAFSVSTLNSLTVPVHGLQCLSQHSFKNSSSSSDKVAIGSTAFYRDINVTVTKVNNTETDRDDRFSYFGFTDALPVTTGYPKGSVMKNANWQPGNPDAWVQTATDSAADSWTPVYPVQGGANMTGWTAMTGTSSKASLSTYAAPTISATYTASQVQAIADGLQALSRRMKAVDDRLFEAGIIRS